MGKDICKQVSLFKESYYNFKLALEDDRLMIYNTKTGAISLFNSDEKNLIQSALCNSNSCNDKDLLENLTSQGFIVKNDTDELMEIKNNHENVKKLKNVIKLIILPAEACNFTCPYCFVYRQRNMYMEDWVYEAMYQHILEKVKLSTNKTLLQLSWYGGEPLLASDKIIAFMERVNLLKKQYDIKIDSSIYTNGYLLTSDLFKKLLECGIRTFQVTIDGERNSHNKLRRLKNGEPTFDVIYSNLINIKNTVKEDEDFKFYIRANFLKSSILPMEEFLNQFMGDFTNDKRFSIYFRPVYHFKTTRNDVEKVVPDICDSDEGVTSQINLAYKVLEKQSIVSMEDNVNIFKPLPQPMHTWCTGRSGNTYIIGADGAIFMCDTMMEEKEKSVGQITTDGQIILNERAKPWTESIFEDFDVKKNNCLKCKLLPVCLGGCKVAMASGYNACFWNENVILDSMKKYADFVLKSKKLTE